MPHARGTPGRPRRNRRGRWIGGPFGLVALVVLGAAAWLAWDAKTVRDELALAPRIVATDGVASAAADRLLATPPR